MKVMDTWKRGTIVRVKDNLSDGFTTGELSKRLKRDELYTIRDSRLSADGRLRVILEEIHGQKARMYYFGEDNFPGDTFDLIWEPDEELSNYES